MSSTETSSTGEFEAVQGALAAGRLSVPDPETGFHHRMYATCPNDGVHAQVRRVERGPKGAIVRVTVRCPRCHTEFDAAPESLHLR